MINVLQKMGILLMATTGIKGSLNSNFSELFLHWSQKLKKQVRVE